jgi:hypothetical protein
MIMLIGSFRYICLRDVALGRDARLDRALHIYDVVFHSH